MARVTLLLVAALIPLINAQCNFKTAKPLFKRSVYDFTLNLVKRINLETESHFIASGLSPWTLISAISLGASEQTLTEIQQVLQLHPHRCFNTLYFKLARHASSKPRDAASMLERSATIFFDGSLYIKQRFLDEVASIGMCDARIVSFNDPVFTAATINGHVSRFTHEAIDEIVTPSDLENMVVVMIDALYFKGAWKVTFPYDDTETSAFYDSRGQQIGDVNLMYVNGRFHVTYMSIIQSKIIELPYGDGSRYSMLIFLPFDNVTVSTVLHAMNRVSITSIFSALNANGEETVDLQLPRFKVSSDINNLKELLMDMGLQSLFESESAAFPGISDYQLSLSNFIQKADIEVTEDGTVASAATAALFEARMLPEQFVVNKPFLFMIVDRFLEIPIFTGAYSKPSIF
ncbi:serpin B6-like [Anticarsia gemmatalis]|uniref:serpin B6-like n=1 Tax=Anticarsia gemmatalis TaxID=129554 RepID=UPI003F7729DC